MATVNFIRNRRQSAASLGKAMDYVKQEKKTFGAASSQRLVSGINCSPDFAEREFKMTRAAYHKDSPVWFYHYTQSFSPEEEITGEKAHEIAKEFAEKAWPDNQILIATHIDAHHIHSHFIVNSVCFESGYMLRQGPRTLEHLRKISDELCMAHGLSVLPAEQPKRSSEPGTREYRSMEKNQSWKMQLMLAIEDAMAAARSREHFIRLMKRRGYEVRWTEERKNITYTTPSGMKCRDSKLHEEKFLKARMIDEFRIRAEILERIETAGQAAVANGGRNRTLRSGDGEELVGAAGLAENTDRAASGAYCSSTAIGNQGSAGELPQQPDAGIGGLCGGQRQSDGRISNGDETVSQRNGEGIILTGWEDQRELFTSSLFGAGQDEEILPETVLDFPDPNSGSGSLGIDMAYLAADLTRIVDEYHRPKDSTTRPKRREKKLALGQKPDDQAVTHEQQM